MRILLPLLLALATPAFAADTVILTVANPSSSATLAAGGSATFDATVDITENTFASGSAAIRLFDQAGATLATSPSQPITQSTRAVLGFSIPHFPIPANATAISLKAILMDATGKVVNPDADAVTFTAAPAKVSLALTNAPAVLRGGRTVADQFAAPLAASIDYTATVKPSSLGVRIIVRRAYLPDASWMFVAADPLPTAIKSTVSLPILQGNAVIPYDADSLVFQPELVLTGGGLVVGDPVVVPLQYLNMVSQGKGPLMRGVSAAIDFGVDYQVQLSLKEAPALYCVSDFSGTTGSDRQAIIKMAEPTDLLDQEKARTFTCSLPVPAAALGARVYLALIPSGHDDCLTDVTTCPLFARSEPRAYSVTDKPVALVDGTRQSFNIIGGSIRTTFNQVSRQVLTHELIRTGIQSFIEAGAPIVSKPLGNAPEPRAPLTSIPGFLGINSTWRLGPSIPSDGSFEADLTLAYAPEDLPDDPNFAEANLTLVSYDQVTGKLKAYTTGVDTTAHTATAHVTEITPYFSLVAFGPFSKRTLNHPVLRTGGAAGTAMSFTNAGSSAADVVVSGYDRFGQGATSLSHPIDPGKVYTAAPSDLFKNPVILDGGWLQVRAGSNTLMSSVAVNDGRTANAYAAPDFNTTAQMLTWVQLDTAIDTEIDLANPSPFPASLKLELHAPDGTLTATAETALPPKGKLAYSAVGLFPLVTPPFVGYLIARSDQEIVATALITSPAGVTPLPGEPLSLVSSHYYLPQYESGIPRNAVINVVNPSGKDANVSIRLTGDDGKPVGPSTNLYAPPGAQVQAQFSFSGSITCDADQPVLLDLLEMDAWGRVRAGLVPDRAGATGAVLGQATTAPGWFSTVSVLNPGTSPANVSLKLFQTDGTANGVASPTIPPGGRVSGQLTQVLSGYAPVGAGYLTVGSDQPVSVASLMGSTDGAVLTNVAPQRAFVSSGGPTREPPVSGALDYSPKSIDFAETFVNASKDATLVLKNNGNSVVNVKSVVIDNKLFSWVGFATSFPVQAGGQAAATVHFAPISPGLQSGNVVINSDDPNQPIIKVPLSGSGVNPPGIAPKLTVSATTLDYGRLAAGLYVDKTVTLSNTGKFPLVITAFNLNNQRYSVRSPDVPVTLQVGDSVPMVVRFTAPQVNSSQNGTLEIVSNDPTNPSLKIALTAFGVLPQVLVSDNFDRDNTDACHLGAANNAFGGGLLLNYMPVFTGGVELGGNALLNGGKDYAGLMFTTLDTPCIGSTATYFIQDLTIKADYLVPTDPSGRITQAGPFFRSFAATAKQQLIAPGSAGYWVQLHSTGEIKVKCLNPEQTIATSGKPDSFNNKIAHTMEVTIEGGTLQVAFDGQLVTFRQDKTVSTSVNVPALWDGPPKVGQNDGTAGILFGAEDNRNSIGGQRLDNLVVTLPKPLNGLPVLNYKP